MPKSITAVERMLKRKNLRAASLDFTSILRSPASTNAGTETSSRDTKIGSRSRLEAMVSIPSSEHRSRK